MHIPDFVWKIIRQGNRQTVKIFGAGRAGHMVLLLTTVGRKSGLPRTTPLQYEQVDGAFYVAAARGPKADWFRNITANPHVEVQVNRERFQALAEPITDPARIADFLELRRKRHPWMIGAMFVLAHGLPPHPDRAHLERLAAQLTMVVLKPLE